MPKGYMLAAEAVQKIKADHESLKIQVNHLMAKANRAQSQVALENIVWVKVQELIEPKTSTTLGHGKAIVQEFDITRNEDVNSDDYDKILTSDFKNQTFVASYGADPENREIDVYNDSLVAIPDKTYIRCFRDFKSGLWMVEAPQSIIGYTLSGITARSGTTLGSGVVKLKYLKDDGTIADITKAVEGQDPTAYSITVYNIADSSVAVNTHVMAKRNALSGNWFVDFAEC